MNEKNLQTVTMEEIWKSQSDGYLPCLLEIFNPDIKWSDNSQGQENTYLRVISDTNSVVYQGKRYLPCKFELTMPEEDGKKIGNATITISAIDSRIVQMLRSTEIQCEVNVKAFFAKKGNTFKFLPLDSIKAKMPSASYNRSTATFNLVFKDVLQVNVPSEMVTQDKVFSVVKE
ncbi:MAG: DUF1833 family protein [Methanobrevibacter sp.]|nr:DUF1833 family protein [Methanobrevibacter sp.]